MTWWLVACAVSVVVSAASSCEDTGPWPCVEDGCPSASVTCADLADACKHPFHKLWKTPPEGYADRLVREECPKTCDMCLEDAPQLTSENWDAALASNKSLFVKFFAPWCGHCKNMKPAWNKLAETLAQSSKVMIADVDCTADGESLCKMLGVEGYPNIKYFNPPDDAGETYEGRRDYASLLKFATTELGPGCSVDALEHCSDEQKKELEEYVAMPADEREKIKAVLEETIANATSKHEAYVEELKAKQNASETPLTKLREEVTSKLKLLAAATQGGTPAEADKDEV